MDIIKEKASYIDHTNLSPVAIEPAIKYLCREAMEYGFHSVCILPYQVRKAKKELAGSAVKVCTVIGFPLGANHGQIKLQESVIAAEDGADELDMVINLAAFKERNHELCGQEIEAIVKAVAPRTVKVIIETAYLDEGEKETACKIALANGAHFLKTSTGFASSGAKTADIVLMRALAGDKAGVKASGGIRDMETMEAMIRAGADRIGTSSGVTIIDEYIKYYQETGK